MIEQIVLERLKNIGAQTIGTLHVGARYPTRDFFHCCDDFYKQVIVPLEKNGMIIKCDPQEAIPSQNFSSDEYDRQFEIDKYFDFQKCYKLI